MYFVPRARAHMTKLAEHYMRVAPARRTAMALGKKFYAVRRGRAVGVYNTWEECKAQVERFKGSEFKSFLTSNEAWEFINQKRTAQEEGGRPAKVARRESRESPVPAPLEELSTFDPPDTIVVYTDGSSRGNGRNGAVAGYGVYWSDEKYRSLDVSKRLEGPVQTNNRAELQAIIAAVSACPEQDKLLRICTDSQYAIKAVNWWMPKVRIIADAVAFDRLADCQWFASAEQGPDRRDRPALLSAPQAARARACQGPQWAAREYYG